MAVGHLTFNDQLPEGRLLRGVLNAIQTVLENGPDIQRTLTLMVDGNGSDPAQFTYMTAKLGTPDNATAKGIWDELNSALAKVTTDGDVTFVNAALKQLTDKLR